MATAHSFPANSGVIAAFPKADKEGHCLQCPKNTHPVQMEQLLQAPEHAVVLCFQGAKLYPAAEHLGKSLMCQWERARETQGSGPFTEELGSMILVAAFQHRIFCDSVKFNRKGFVSQSSEIMLASRACPMITEESKSDKNPSYLYLLLWGKSLPHDPSLQIPSAGLRWTGDPVP